MWMYRLSLALPVTQPLVMLFLLSVLLSVLLLILLLILPWSCCLRCGYISRMRRNFGILFST